MFCLSNLHAKKQYIGRLALILKPRKCVMKFKIIYISNLVIESIVSTNTQLVSKALLFLLIFYEVLLIGAFSDTQVIFFIFHSPCLTISKLVLATLVVVDEGWGANSYCC